MSDSMYGIEFQRKVLKLCCINTKFYIDYGEELREDYFETPSLKNLYNVIKNYIETYQKELQPSDLIVLIDDFVQSRGYSGETFKLMKEEARNIFASIIEAESMIISSLLSFARRQKLKLFLLKAVKTIESGGNIEALVPELNNVVATGQNSDLGLKFSDLKDFPKRYKEMYNPKILIKTGFHSFDEALMGGMGPGEVHVVVASPKVGKSTLGVNIGSYALISGKTVFHISLEIREELVAMKYCARLTGLNYKDLLREENLDIFNSKIDKFEKYQPNLHIKYWTMGTVNTLAIRSYISKIKNTYNVNPDLIIVDYDDPLIGETKIPLLNGTEVEIKDLVGKDEFWLYACKGDGTVVPGRGHSARVAREVDELIEITLDNGESIKSTINHNHMLRDGTYRRADELKEGDSMMPLYRYKEGNYEQVKCNKTNKFIPTHYMVASNCLSSEYDNCLERTKNELELGKKTIPQVHHKLIPGEVNKFDTLNNDPSNLQWLTNSEHKSLHHNCNWKDKDWRLKKSEKTKQQWDNDFYEKRSRETSEQWKNTNIKSIISDAFKKSWTEGNLSKNKNEECPYCNELLNTTFSKWRAHLQHCIKNPKKLKQLEEKNQIKLRNCNKCNKSINISWYGLMGHKRNCNPINHKILSIKRIKLDKPVPVYCLTVDDYSNYALSAGIFTHNCLVPTSGRTNDMYEDAGVIYKDLIELADYFKAPICTFAQPRRDAWNNSETEGGVIRAQELAHSAKKAHACTSLSSMNFAENSNKGILYIDRNRRGESSTRIHIERDLSKALIREFSPES